MDPFLVRGTVPVAEAESWGTFAWHLTIRRDGKEQDKHVETAATLQAEEDILPDAPKTGQDVFKV